MNRQRYPVQRHPDIDDCVETHENLVAKLLSVEARLAERLGLGDVDVRAQLVRLDLDGALVEDELVADWHELYSVYVSETRSTSE